MSKSQVSSDVMVLFSSLTIVSVYVFTVFFFIDNTDRFRIGLAQEEWRVEAESMVDQLISSPNCFGYVKNIIYYDNTTGSLLTVKSGVPNAIDADKLLIDRVNSCLRLLTPEYRVYMELKVISDSIVIFESINIDRELYFNPSTFEKIVVPVKIIFDDQVAYGQLEAGVSVTQEYFNARIS